jgi:hypothetical protein
MLLARHLFSLWFWLFVRLYQTVEAHSGYNFPWNPTRFIPFWGGKLGEGGGEGAVLTRAKKKKEKKPNQTNNKNNIVRNIHFLIFHVSCCARVGQQRPRVQEAAKIRKWMLRTIKTYKNIYNKNNTNEQQRAKVIYRIREDLFFLFKRTKYFVASIFFFSFSRATIECCEAWDPAGQFPLCFAFLIFFAQNAWALVLIENYFPATFFKNTFAL